MPSRHDPFDRAEHRRAWAAIAFTERRQILRAVNRGQAAASRRDAALAIGAARMQQRFWRWVWVIGPLVALVQLRSGFDVFLSNLVVSTLVVGGMAAWFYRQARKAEAANIVLLEGPRKPKKRKPDPSPGTDRDKDHVPGPVRPPPIRKHDEFKPDPNTSRKKQRRRKG